MIIDNAAPMSQGHLPNNTRITALKAPIVDEDIGVSVSIRLLHPSKVNKEQIISSGTATRKMVDFLCMCIRYGVSTVVAGVTSSGKTTLLNALLNTIPDNKRIFTIESGSRELSLVRKTRYGNVTNNVVHTLSRPSENEVYDISQEDLVVASLRFNPDIVCVGEMRDVEAYAAVEASLTGHTVVSTVHAFASKMAHMRIANLCQKRYHTDSNTATTQAALAFPLVVYTHKLDNNERKIMDISECEILPNGERKYHTLFRYKITRNEETFNGWSKTSTGEKAYDDKQSVKNLTSKDGDIVNIYAMWTDGSVTLPTPTRTGYTFSGWYTAVSGGTKIGNGGAKYTPSANITLYGHWTPITYTIKFDKNGATGGSTASMAMTYDVSKKLTANGFTWENHKWLKWNTKADGTGTSYTDEQSVKNLSSKQDATITLYAQWEKIEENLSLYLEPIMPNAAYRENTDVVTGFRIVNNSKTDITPNKNVSVVFTVKNGDTAIRRVTVSDVVVPAENKNILYFKWTVPVNISTSSVKISGEIFINGVADYVTTNNYTTCKYTISETPDTQFEVSAPDGFTKPSVPATSTNTATWNEWKYENGEFKEVKYGISISTDTLEITPAASANPTKKDGVWVMKSGYGIELTVANNVKQVSGYTMPGSDAYTKPQLASATFPEFGYSISTGKCRTLEQISNKWTFRENGSYGHIHFTPLWYPDGNYCVSVIQRDCWTPTGMISRTVNSNNVTISGSAYDDWTIN